MAKKFNYVPVLRWKRGERVGIRLLDAATRADVVPLFQLGPDTYVGKKAKKKVAAIPPAPAFGNELKAAWGTQPFFLDASNLPPVGPVHEMLAVADACNSLGLSMMPVTYLGASAPYRNAVNKIALMDGRGLGLRVDLAEMSSASSWFKHWPHAAAETDLLVDLADNVRAVNDLGKATISAFADLHKGKTWRSVTIMGSSLPENFTGYAAGTYTIERVEWMLWQALQKAALPYVLNFGDYATVAVTPPPSGIRWGYPINVKYTLPAHHLICRGVNTTGLAGVDMDVQLIGHARSIVKYAGRKPIPTCWADQAIDDIAAKKKEPGNLESWVQLGSNRHITLVRSALP